MPVAIRDAYRTIVVTTGTGSGGLGGVSTANSPASTFQLDGGFGISLVYDNVNNKVTIVNTGNGTGALTTITEQESLGTYYPIFSRAPSAGDINGVTGTYQLDTMYIEQTARPLTYNPGTGMLSSVGLTLSGTLTANSTTLIGPSASANLTRFPGALAVFSTVAAGIQQNEISNMGVMAEGVANSSNTNIWGVGFYGAGYTNGATRSGGVIGEGHVSASADTGSAIGVRGYANDTHDGGSNIGLYGDATNSTTNYSLYLNNGGIYNNFALTWTMNGNITFSGSYIVTIPTLNLTNALGVSYGGTGTGTASITAFNNITGYSAAGATGTTSTNLVFSTSPTITTPTISGHFTAEGVTTTGATGTGKLVFDGSPTLTTPTLGAATATSINKMAITAPASSSTLAVADGKTFTVNNTITLAGTDLTTITLPSTTGTLPLNNQTFYIGTTSVAINRASANLALTGITSIDGSAGSATKATNLAGGNSTTLLGSIGYQSNIDTTTLLSPNTTTTKKFLRQTGDGSNGTAPAWDTLVTSDIPAHYIGTTSITFSRASASQSLTGITSIDGYAAGIAGGAIGQIPYQSAANTTVFLSGNTTTTPNFVTSTGTGSAAQAPTLTSSTGTGSVVLGTNPTITAPTSSSASSTSDTDATVDASVTELYAYVQSASGTARTINISNLTAGRKITLYLRNTNAATKVINIAASTTAASFVSVNLSKGDAGGTSATAVTLAVSSGTATVTVFNANGTIGGSIS
jgi:hypothetical protein